MTPADRDRLGRVVRKARAAWVEQQGFSSTWVIPWNEMAEIDREADRRIAEAVARVVRAKRGGKETP